MLARENIVSILSIDSRLVILIEINASFLVLLKIDPFSEVTSVKYENRKRAPQVKMTSIHQFIRVMPQIDYVIASSMLLSLGSSRTST
jgi:hypothetical protein